MGKANTKLSFCSQYGEEKGVRRMPFESQWFQIPDADSDELLPEWDSARIHPVLWRQVNGLLCPSLTWLTDLAVQLFIFIDLKLFQDVKIISASTQVVSGTRYMMQVEITGSDGEVSTHTYTYVVTHTHLHIHTYTYTPTHAYLDVPQQVLCYHFYTDRHF